MRSAVDSSVENGIVDEAGPSLIREGLIALLVLKELDDFLRGRREHYKTTSSWMSGDFFHKYRGRIEGLDEVREKMLLEEGRLSKMLGKDPERFRDELGDLDDFEDLDLEKEVA